ncbi:NAD-dependent epimerase/dehydratase family protein [Hymenobacter taeanensis]|uniref:NAD-dependent epimerase/dehydratase family protein n=1 Tax=Hymenobacter taeanensis TaxID=2735321 RepID=A0A6M6BDB5_9BACT|nr:MULTISPECIES: NAD-dependent epimerase/dehydratase family protein [Hymenobacter]QJX46216.1 NAD-dependent epimerase/dehydratase family protein [Hymenobacter taeanensis]UOQ80071.1 NAD-dependent epimerase/dehydratase family protein [Hymenobacter sp. 5414T-23]
MIFVTGGSGLVGSFLIAELIARGESVRALYRGENTPQIPGADQVEWVSGDLRDALGLRVALAGVTHVFHCAGLVSYAPQDETALQQINVEGTANVVDACLERPGIRLGYVSSVAALGSKPGEQPTGTVQLDESAKWDLGAEHNAYATSKYLAELEVWRGIAEGLQAVAVNPSVILGPADWNRSSTRLFRYVYNQHAFYTPGNINVVDVRDVVDMLVRLTLDTTISGERYVLSAQAIPLHEFLGQAAACFRRKAPTVAVPEWAAETIWRFEHVRSVLTGARPLITKDTARAGRHPVEYSALKVQRVLGQSFRPVANTIAWCCEELMAKKQPTKQVA